MASQEAGRGGAERAATAPAAPNPAKAEGTKAEAPKVADAKAQPGKAETPDAADPLAKVPQHLRGKDVPETIEKLLGDQKTARDFVAKFGLPVEKPEEYDFKPSEVSAKYFGTDADNALRDGALATLAKLGVPKLMGPAVVNGLMEWMDGLGMAEPPVNAEAETAALVPESAKGLPRADQEAAVKARLDNAMTFLKVLPERGLDQNAVNQLATLMDRADGVRAVEFLMAKVNGPGIATGGSPVDAQTAAAEVDRMMQDPRYLRDLEYTQTVRQRQQALR